MHHRTLRDRLLGVGISALLLNLSAAHAQVFWQQGPRGCPPPCGGCATPPAPAVLPQSPYAHPVQPAQPVPPQAQPTQPPAQATQPPAPERSAPDQAQPENAQNNAQEPSLDQEQAAAGSGESSAFASAAVAAPGGYLDNPIPKTMFRLRYDSIYNVNRFDRSEFLFAQWREFSFHAHAINGQGAWLDPKARGFEPLPTRVDYQEVSATLEYAPTDRVSVYLDAPYRFVKLRDLKEDNPIDERKPNGAFFNESADIGENFRPPTTEFSGFADLKVGFKAALLASETRYLTLQFQVDLPTGEPGDALGVGHVSLEPSLMFLQRFGDRVTVQGQFGDWIPIGGGKNVFEDGSFDGNILTYGLGLGYDVYKHKNFKVTPITEFVGWTVLNGLETTFSPVTGAVPAGVDYLPKTHGTIDVAGQTIVNAKVGVRTYFGCGNDIYVGWGHALTRERWYENILRVEYRKTF